MAKRKKEKIIVLSIIFILSLHNYALGQKKETKSNFCPDNGRIMTQTDYWLYSDDTIVHYPALVIGTGIIANSIQIVTAPIAMASELCTGKTRSFIEIGYLKSFNFCLNTYGKWTYCIIGTPFYVVKKTVWDAPCYLYDSMFGDDDKKIESQNQSSPSATKDTSDLSEDGSEENPGTG